MKALCSERFTDWSTKFEPFGLRCKEVTGDSELDDYYELQNIHIIMTTPVSLMFHNDVLNSRHSSALLLGTLLSSLHTNYQTFLS